jgi:lipopolysaccharide/colanic/teichoic acid biosynthesis glycosyltransferase
MQKTITRKEFSEQNVLNYGELVISDSKKTESIKRLLMGEVGKDAVEYIGNFIDNSEDSTFYSSTTTRFNIDKLPSLKFINIVNIQKINDIRWINKFFESVNDKIPKGGYFIGTAETYQLRREYLYKKYPILVSYFVVQSDFFLRRVFPKLPIFKKLYFFLTKGRGRGLSKAETLGRLVSCGFEIIEYREIDNRLIFITKKIKEPAYDLNPSYGPLFKMKRIGKDGKIIHVYKLRTMHPYSEYLQDFVLNKNGFSANGKPAKDFRLTSWGRFYRKYWLDEIPQLINVFKGEMKLVGTRPLSMQIYKNYPEDIKDLRNKYKPGCFPPYVALLMQNMEASIEAERIYLLEKENHPYTTDIKYFLKSIFNILTNKIRSS